MKRFFGLVAALTLALSLSAAAVQVGDAVGERFTLPVYEAEWEVLRLTNAARLARGLAPLSMFDRLHQASRTRARELAADYRSDHTRPDGSNCFTVLDDVALTDWSVVGENIAQGQRNSAEVVTAWMNSPGHRANILEGEFTHMGAGYDGLYSWEQLFLGACSPRPEKVLAGPAGERFPVGTSLDEMGAVLVLRCSHGASCLPVTAGMCQGYDPEAAGTQTVTVSYGGRSVEMTVTLTGETAAGTGTWGDLTYEKTPSGITITGYTGPGAGEWEDTGSGTAYRRSGTSGGDLVIPAAIDGLPVTAIASRAFCAATLDSVTFPAGLRTIADSAFYCARIVQPVVIPAGVEEIGAYAFSYVSGLPAMCVEEGNRAYRSVGGVLFSADMTTLILYPQGMSGQVYTVPERVTLLGCTSFANCGLTALIVPNAETRAMGYTFANCGLTLYGVPGGDLEEQYSGLDADRLTFAPLDQAPACDPYTAWAAAEELCGLGLFQGKGTLANGLPDFALADPCTRQEALVLLLRLLGEAGAVRPADASAHPFADVDAWASAYVGYAYQNGIAQGAGPTAFRGGDAATPAQCVTFVLRALGYESGADFAWDSPWTLSDRIGLTLGRYGAEAGKTADRGGMVLLCRAALDCPMADGSGTLRQHLQARGVLQEESDFIEFQ